MKDSSRDEIIEAIAETLVDSGLVRSQTDYKPVPALAAMLKWHVENWDLFRSFLRRRTMQVLPSHLPKVWEAYVRLAVIDLAIRIAAHLHLAGSSPAALVLLDWTSRADRGTYLNQKRRQARLSRKNFADGIDDVIKVNDNTFDAWMYRGARPSDDNIVKIAKVLANRIKGSSAASIALELRALYWVSDVADMLAEHIGGETVGEAIGRLHRYAEAAYRIIGEQIPAENCEETLTALADLGANARVAKGVLSALIAQETDEEWREDLRGAGAAWVHRVLSVNMSVRLAEEDALIQETEGRLLEDWDVSNPEAYTHYRRSLELQAQEKLYEALVEVEIAARLDPLDPANHFTIGSVKTGLGIKREDVVLVNEGLDALWLAVTLDPNWILPWTEIGSTLYYTDRPEEAVAHLRSVKAECGPLDSQYHCTLGRAYWRLEQFPEALAAFEGALDLDPEETSVLLAASELALLTGDGKKHRQYLRKAQHFGADEGTLRFWEMLREFGEKDQDDTETDEHEQ